MSRPSSAGQVVPVAAEEEEEEEEPEVMEYEFDYVPRWSYGTCGCIGSLEVCCLTLWCPCVAYGRLAEAAQPDFMEAADVKAAKLKATVAYLCCAPLFWPCLGCYRRQKLAHHYKIDMIVWEDLLCHILCHPCSMCQEGREVRRREPNGRPEPIQVRVGTPAGSRAGTPAGGSRPGSAVVPPPPGGGGEGGGAAEPTADEFMEAAAAAAAEEPIAPELQALQQQLLETADAAGDPPPPPPAPPPPPPMGAAHDMER